MSLIKCPECDKEISNKAEKCPNCACPISASIEESYIQTIEETGKSLKLQKVLSIIMMIIGGVMIGNGMENKVFGIELTGWALLQIGLVWFIITKIRIWWNHK